MLVLGMDEMPDCDRIANFAALPRLILAGFVVGLREASFCASISVRERGAAEASVQRVRREAKSIVKEVCEGSGVDEERMVV